MGAGRKIYLKEYAEMLGLTREQVRNRIGGTIPRFDGSDDPARLNSRKFWWESTLFPERFEGLVDEDGREFNINILEVDSYSQRDAIKLSQVSNGCEHDPLRGF